MRRVVAALVLIVGLVGCTTGDNPYTPPTPGPPATATATPAPQPTAVPAKPAPAPAPAKPQPAPAPAPAPSGVQWGPAGAAPQDVQRAADVLKVPSEQASLLTVLYPRPGDPTPIGWVLGSSESERRGVRVRANRVPRGTCVDYDPNVSRVTGTIDRSERLTPLWTRALLGSDGSFEGLKATFYWTPCEFSGGAPSGPTSLTVSEVTKWCSPDCSGRIQQIPEGIKLTLDQQCFTVKVPGEVKYDIWDGVRVVSGSGPANLWVCEATFRKEVRR